MKSFQLLCLILPFILIVSGFTNETEKGDWDDKRLLNEREIDLKERNFAFEQKVAEFHRWLSKLKLSGNAKRTHITAICSFFAFHRLFLLAERIPEFICSSLLRS